MTESRPSILRTVESQLDPAHTALIIVDVQNDFVHPQGAYGQRVDDLWKDKPLIPRMLDNLPRLVDAARRAGCLVVFVRWFGDDKYVSDSLSLLMERTESNGKVCISGTFGAEFYGDLKPSDSPREVVVTKFRYSAFTGSDLDLILRSNGIRTVVVTGTVTSVCVESTARDAFTNDYYMVIVGDACADWQDSRQETAMDVMGRVYGTAQNVDDVVKIWSTYAGAGAPAVPAAAKAPA